MSEILFQYHQVNPTTWVYLSSLFIIGLYFKFGRFWSLRNLDLALLILLAPGLLMAQYGGEARARAMRLIAVEPARLTEVDETPPIHLAGETSGDRVTEIDLIVVDLQSEPRPAEVKNVVGQRSDGVIENTGQVRFENKTAGGNKQQEEPANAGEISLQRSRQIESLGFIWLFGIGALLLVRMLLDPTVVRRPLLEPNLSSGGLTFSGCSLFVFLMANVITSDPVISSPVDIGSIQKVAPGEAPVERNGTALRRGPRYAALKLIPSIPMAPLVEEHPPRAEKGTAYGVVAKTIAIFCHFAVVLGIVAIGYLHFGNTRTGVGVATLYLVVPYTAQMTGEIDHVVPAAILVLAVLSYRRPVTCGFFIGFATSLVYYPLFLLPLWISFYWRRGLIRFVTGVAGTVVVMAASLVFIPGVSYWENLKQMFGLWLPVQAGLEGFWALVLAPPYRILVLAAFLALSGSLAFWPAQKNLGTLLSCSAAVMLATQFWHGYGGGLYMGWYLPLALLTIFRPNLEDRMALAVLSEGWMSRRACHPKSGFDGA